MKTLFLLLLVGLIHPLIGNAQTRPPLMHVYAYLRESTPGTIPGDIPDEKGDLHPREPEKIRTWFIFIEYRKGAAIDPVAIRINHIRYLVRKEIIPHTPVVFERPGFGDRMEKDSMVPATNQPVLKLQPLENIRMPHTTHPVKIRIEYYWKGRKYLSPEQPLKTLPPLILQ